MWCSWSEFLSTGASSAPADHEVIWRYGKFPNEEREAGNGAEDYLGILPEQL